MTDERGPIPGAMVCAHADPGLLSSALSREPFCASSGRDGHWRIDGLPAAIYVVTAHAPRHRPARFRDAAGNGSIALAVGEHRRDVDLVLRSGGVAVRGVVQDGTGGVIEGAWVTATPDGWPRMKGPRVPGWAVRTDAEGSFEIWVARGETRLWADAEGYAPGSWTAAAPSSTVVLRLLPESVVEGTVVDHATRAPVPDALVLVASRDTSSRVYTDERGRFRIDRLAAGRVSVTAHTDHAAGRLPGRISLHLGEHVEVTVALHPARLVQGRVVDADDGTPCGRGRVGLVDGSGNASGGLIETDGTVRIAGVRPGRFQVMIECTGKLAPAEPPVLVVTELPVLEQTWTVTAGLALAGVVVDDIGSPVEGAVVTAMPTGVDGNRLAVADGVSDGAGRFTLRGLREGRYRIVPSTVAPAREGEPAEVDVSVAGPVDLRLVLPRGARIFGHVRDASGQPVADRQVLAFALGALDGNTSRGFSDVDGAYELTQVRAGEIQLHVEGSAEGSGPKVSIAVGEEREIDLVAPPADLAISGRVVGPDGDPVSDASVSAFRESYTGWAWRDTSLVLTGDDGRFRIDGLAEGAHRITATQGSTSAEVTGVGAGDDVEIVLAAPASIAGTVEVTGGEPLDSFELTLTGPDFLHERFEHAGGDFRVDGLSPGAYAIAASAEQGSGMARVELGSGEAVTDLRIELRADGTVTGTLVASESGDPLPGVDVRPSTRTGTFVHRSTDRLSSSGVSDASGRFEVRASAGPIILMVGARPGADRMQLYVPVTVPAGGPVDAGEIRVPRPRIQPGQARGWFGFRYVHPEPMLGSAEGPKITEVSPGSPMAAAGFAMGDEIIAVDGVDLRGGGAPNLAALLQVPVGAALTFVLGEQRSIEVTAATRP